jgi:hypothetical protein
MPGIPGLQGPAGPPGIYDPNLDEEGRPGAEGVQGPIGNFWEIRNLFEIQNEKRKKCLTLLTFLSL